MANVIIQDIEVAGEKVLSWITKAEVKVSNSGPAVAALATLLGAVASSIESAGEAAAADGINFALDATSWNNIKSVWPDVKALAADLGIKIG